MTNKEKQLLLKDLCSRLPYIDTMVQWQNESYQMISIGFGRVTLIKPLMSITAGSPLITEVKPYLRPMSSMTEDERIFIDKFNAKIDCENGCYIETCTTSEDGISEVYMEEMCELIKYLNSRHFDYHRIYDEKDRRWKSMIEIGLAIEAPEGMYK